MQVWGVPVRLVDLILLFSREKIPLFHQKLVAGTSPLQTWRFATKNAAFGSLGRCVRRWQRGLCAARRERSACRS